MWVRIWAFLDWCFFGPASARAGLLGGTLRVLQYPVRGDPGPVARGNQPAGDEPGVHHAPGADPAARLQFRGAEDLRRPARPGTDRVRVLPPARTHGGAGAHGAGAAVRRPRLERRRGLTRPRAPRLDARRHHQEGRGQPQLPLARRAAAQLRAPRGRVHRPADRRARDPGRIRGPAACCLRHRPRPGGGAPAASCSACAAWGWRWRPLPW